MIKPAADGSADTTRSLYLDGDTLHRSYVKHLLLKFSTKILSAF